MIGKTSKGANGASTTRPPKTDTSGADGPQRVDVPGIHSAGTANRFATTHPADVDLDAITPATTVNVSAIPTAVGSPELPVHRALQDYWIAPPPGWDGTDTQGARIIRGRKYVTLPDNQIVQIAMDAETGFYRAKRSSERDPSGPVLQPDPDGRFWREQSDVEPLPHTLSDTRLETFRSDIDFTGVEPGSDGLHRFDGKLYAVIRDHAYQVLNDLDASTPTTPVLRIVRAEDAVARDANNVYVGTRPGRSETVVFDPQHGWVEADVPGAGGMRRAQASGSLFSPGPHSQLAHALLSPTRRVRDLFPSFDEAQVHAILQNLGPDVPGRLARYEHEFHSLRYQLSFWQHGNQAIARERIIDCWRKKAVLHLAADGAHVGERLNLSGLDLTNLPSLEGIDFSHVTSLDLKNNKLILATHLRPFKHIFSLDLSKNRLMDMPYDLRDMPRLSHLNLEGNRITIDRFSAPLPETLQVLVLNDNTIRDQPDFSRLQRMRKLALARTGLSQWPSGVNDLQFLELVDLRSNWITEIPDSIVAPPQERLMQSGHLSDKVFMLGNPLSQATLEKLKLYLARLRAAGFTLSNPRSLLSPVTDGQPSRRT